MNCCIARSILVGRLQDICEKENVKCSGEALETLIEASDGDLRRAITFLQSTASHNTEFTVTVDDINEITGVCHHLLKPTAYTCPLHYGLHLCLLLQRIPDHWLDGLLEKCRSGVYDIMEAYMSDFATEGYSATQLLYQLHERVVFSGDLSDQQKSAIAEKMAVSFSRIWPLALIFLFRLSLRGMRERQHQLRLFLRGTSVKFHYLNEFLIG